MLCNFTMKHVYDCLIFEFEIIFVRLLHKEGELILKYNVKIWGYILCHLFLHDVSKEQCYDILSTLRYHKISTKLKITSLKDEEQHEQ